MLRTVPVGALSTLQKRTCDGPPPYSTRENENGYGFGAKLRCKSHRHQTFWLSSLGYHE
jgi:hypothetical protein